MRRTTKIFIGSILFLFILISGWIFYFWHLEKENDKIKYTLEPELEYIDIPKAKVVYIDSLATIDNNQLYLHGEIKLHNSEQGKNQLHINKQIAAYTNTTLKGDTLFITFEAEKILKLFSQSKFKLFHIRGTDISLPVDSTVNIISQMNWLNTDIKNVKMKSLNILLTCGTFTIENNEIDTLTTDIEKGNSNHFIAMNYHSKNNIIDTYNLNLDNINLDNLTIENCTINNLNYIGKEKNEWHTRYYRTPMTNSKHINWYPKHKGQELQLILKDTTSLVRER